ncbi:MAG: gliding motility-associated C-terminal domain-containing protein [Flavobacteriales bacterium]|nr:gliding motility-associated C-terminal domain-containing protein [Flavobacteriales bacterium]
MKTKLRIIIISGFGFFFFGLHSLNAQDILLLTENFELGGASFVLNGAELSSNTGDNQWIVNNQFTGNVDYPNTTDQNNTNGGTISYAPYSNYLHIHDQPSGITNANYDPTVASDRFSYMAFGICTYAVEEVHFSFFYLCEGSPLAYGTIYYSLDGGPWTQFGLAQYSGMSVWQYADITDPLFSNVGSLRFGFRWQNNADAPPYSQSFAIDDINIVGSYSEIDPVTINVLSVSPNPVCQGSYITIEYELSDTLCDGNYQIELSNSSGNFTGQFGSWVFGIFYPQTTGFVTVQIPTTAQVGDCYKFRINRLSPPPEITGIASDCFEVIECPNIITTLQPVVTLDTNAVCIGSAIDIPFTSTGVYAANNDYVAELSDWDGTFPNSPTVVGSSDDSNTYDPQLGDPPGSVGGLVPEVEPGCNYFLRIISTNPDAIGSVWGPFCIQACDITTNNMEDLFFCVSECSVDPDGENQLIDIDVNTWDGVSNYLPGNIFTTQLLSSMDFSQIGSDGIYGSVAATDDTQLNVHIPCKDSLDDYGIPLGMNYMRIVATESTTPENALGSLIRVTIGAFTDVPQIITAYSYPNFIQQNSFCVGETVALFFEPYDYFANSTYLWTCNGINGGQPFVSPSGANSNSLYVITGGTGVLNFSVQETNYGCVSPWTPPMSITILGDPVVNIIGPDDVCVGDTVSFQVNFYPDTYYSWTTDALPEEIAYQDTSNNEMNVAFTEFGDYTFNVNVLNLCGSGSDSDNITVIESPVATATPDTSFICINDSAQLSVSGGGTYSWSDGSGTVGSTATISVTPLDDEEYYATVTGPGGCTDVDTVNVVVELPDPPTLLYDSICPGGQNDLTLYSDVFGSAYLWSNGSNGVYTTVHETGVYGLSVYSDAVCPELFEFHIEPMEPGAPILYIDSVCPGGNGFFPISLQSDAGGVYEWDSGESLPLIWVNDTGTYVLNIYMPDSVCPRILEFKVIPDSCYALPELFYYVPNSFTPNDDALNDVFGPVFSDPSLLSEYRMMIFDRWGEVVFETTDTEKKWMGNIHHGEYYVSDGAYVWQIQFLQAGMAEKTKLIGHVVMVR